MSDGRAGRALRGVLAGSLTTFLALAFHVFGGGVAPAAPALLGSLLATVWVCVLLAGRRMRWWSLAIAVAISQAILHAVFSVATASVVVTGLGSHTHGHDQGAVIVSLAHGGHAMALSHVLAGVTTLAGLILGDRLLTSVLTGARRAARALARLAADIAAPLPAAPRVPVATGSSVAAFDRFLRCAPRRGPPALLAV